MKAILGGNNVKVYNLSAGRSLPDWITAKKRRKLAKRDVDIRRRIELIQDFTMPDVSSCVKMSLDGQYIVATGTYKPCMKCYEVCALSQKFERHFDAGVIEFEIISDDYSKIVFLQEDRYLEFHNQGGKWFRTRIPKFGRDLAYHYPTCELYIASSGSEIYRMNLEQGKFVTSLQTDASSVNKCLFNPIHYLFTCGTADGVVETYDPRSQQRVGTLDCALHMAEDNALLPFMYGSIKQLGITSLAYNDSLTLAVGTQIGKILLYDIRSSKPLGYKDHGDGFPIKDVEFHRSSNMVVSMSKNAIKVWEKDTFKIHTSMESDVQLNDLCVVQDSGMMLMATEDSKMQIYFLPTLGAAPRWCGHLDAMIEELEEEEISPAYDDYKFVSLADLKQLGLEDLIGTNVLKAVMHGYYMDVRLYNKARMIAKPTEYEDSVKRKIKQKISETNERKIVTGTKQQQIKATTAANADLFTKLDREAKIGREDIKNTAGSILQDDRFKGLFDNSQFNIGKDTVMFDLTQPLSESKSRVVEGGDDEQESTFDSNRLAVKKYVDSDASDVDSIIDGKDIEEEQEEDENLEDEEVESDEDELEDSDELEDEDEDSEQEEQDLPLAEETRRKKSNLRNFVSANDVTDLKDGVNRDSNLTLGERLEKLNMSNQYAVRDVASGNKEVTFAIGGQSKMEKIAKKNKEHQNQRKKMVRSTKALKGKYNFNKPF